MLFSASASSGKLGLLLADYVFATNFLVTMQGILHFDALRREMNFTAPSTGHDKIKNGDDLENCTRKRNPRTEP